ncbi:MAG: serine/threonine-protein kinase [Planctomycetota bacterium]|nr:serine/threonine-protein kinase [Planctomycetota bacterium]
MNVDSGILEQLVEAHATGQVVDVPAEIQAEFDQAVAAHTALRGLLEQTLLQQTSGSCRLPPDVSDHYEIERELGRGGMGVVYLAKQRSLNRRVALKVLRPGERTFGPLVRRFLDEAQHLARLRHPNIVSIHEVGEAAGEPYFTMEFIDGSPLSAVIARGPLTPTGAVEILKQVASAVQHAHRHGIIHRDLKPGNVLIDHGGTAFVTDFGLARDVSQSSELTQTGELLGTPQYMSPEQARGQTSLIGESTDIHAIGLLLFEMLTGRPAFISTSPADVLVRLLNEDPPLLRSFDRRIPRDLETICQKSLQKFPEKRYASVSAFLEDIRRYEAGEPLVARRTGIFTYAARWMLRHWKIAATAMVTAMIALLVVAPLLDKSFGALVAWGDEEFALGHTDMAAQVYQRALQRASEDEKVLLIDRLVRTCRSMEDPKAAVELAMQVVEFAPDESFGQHNYLVAKALIAREHSGVNQGTINIWHEKPEPVLELIKTRLELALEGNLPEDQRLEAEEILGNVNLAIADGAYPVRYHPEYLYKVPSGNAEELRGILNNETIAVWNRARAGIALGRLCENLGKTENAKVAYREAYELARSVYPMYSGVKDSVGTGSRMNTPDAQECGLIQDLVGALHRLDLEAMPLPKGRIEFDVIGIDLPPTVYIDIELKLYDSSISNPHEGLPHNLPRLLPLRQDRPVSVTVLDGTYRFDHSGLSYRWDFNAGNVGPLVQIDIEDWPSEITVQGNIVRLPPVRARMAKEIQLLSPVGEAAVNLADTELRWSPIPDAKTYRVSVSVRQELPRPTSSMFLSLNIDNAELRFVDIDKGYLKVLRENLIAGSQGEWRVDAFDKDGRCIGKSLKENRFLVVTALPLQ